MDLMMMLPLLVTISAISTCGEPARGFHHSKSSFGEILKPPPPPPPLLNRLPSRPVPFHSGSGSRVQRQNQDVGYQYPPPPPPPPIPPTANFRLPSPFYKPYSYNFVPPPQPFLTTPSPSVFNKLQNWLFPPSSPNPPQIIGPSAVANVATVKKECNPCNLAPWIPVLRYNAPENLNYKEAYEATTYSAPPAGTYGPPAATPTPSYRAPQPFYGPSKQQISTYGAPNVEYGPPSTTYGTPISSYGLPAPSTLYNNPSVSYSSPSSSYSSSSSTYGPPQPTEANTPQTQLHNPGDSYRLPKVSYPTGFKNSYGEPITASYPVNELYPVSATAAESSKIKAEVVSADGVPPNVTYSNPAPFVRNQGRGIHTLQPVALPNLSVSPLPPIFNARPFRTNIPSGFVNHADNSKKEVRVVASVPVAEFTSSIEYPVKYIQSPVVDINIPKRNQTKAYRIIPYSDSENSPHDASSQASEAHTASANNDLHDHSFESTGTAAGNDLYDGFSTTYSRHNEGHLVPPPSPTHATYPQNHKPEFEELKGMSDATDENGLKSDQHLQSIDSPILYLRPNAPHKDFKSLFSVTTTTSSPTVRDYEIYDDATTPSDSTISTQPDMWNNQYLETPEKSQTEDENNNIPRIVQIIIPYTTANDPNLPEPSQVNDWVGSNDNYENQGRKVPLYTQSSNTFSDFQYTTPTSAAFEPTTNAEIGYRESPRLTAASILNDLYDVKEPPFDIIRLQNNIDGWTEQEFKHYKLPQKIYKGKYAKKIPEEYLTTPPTVYYTTPVSQFEMSFFDHEGSSSVQHAMKENYDESATQRSSKEYNLIDHYIDRKTQSKEHDQDKLKPHIYTAASSFRSSTTTTPPWGMIQTSISPLTKEKVYVVTATPWREGSNRSKEWSEGAPFESQRTSSGDTSASASDNLPFKSPRFSNRPFVPPSGGGRLESMKTESSFSLGKSWHHSINALEWSGSEEQRNSTVSTDEGDDATSPPRSHTTTTNHNQEETSTTVTAESTEDTTESES